MHAMGKIRIILDWLQPITWTLQCHGTKAVFVFRQLTMGDGLGPVGGSLVAEGEVEEEGGILLL